MSMLTDVHVLAAQYVK